MWLKYPSSLYNNYNYINLNLQIAKALWEGIFPLNFYLLLFFVVDVETIEYFLFLFLQNMKCVPVLI